jgi:anti-anti-sigma regulatory factor
MPTDRSLDGPSLAPSGPWLEVRSGRRFGVLEVSVLGEADLTNHGDLQRLLDALDVSGSARVDLDLGQLAFADTRSACHLLDFVQRSERTGCEVWVVGAQPAVARLLGLLTEVPHTA